MKLVGVIDEDWINYKVCSMILEFPYCSFKCGANLCQNSELAHAPLIEVDPIQLAYRYISNPITEAIVCQGLEPIDSIDELCEFIHELRCNFMCHDDVVIYTGYTKEELENMTITSFEYSKDINNHPTTKLPISTSVESVLTKLENYDNIIIKYGRYIPDQPSHYDDVLGVILVSDNQFAERIS